MGNGVVRTRVLITRVTKCDEIDYPKRKEMVDEILELEKEHSSEIKLSY